ncbi:hypothetical protein [Caulobacter segnis]|uniref:DUF2987 domain-containing protein n=1 Tax=Caulobacter segnis TaxID=88688 RepID=A0A2W5WUP3_9CAUL|nr:hypothetical protein [Caulobacter segnis]PZR31684.1 MAG: hypothetical protein DI526_19015 [Caulobacter segnis]
MKRALALMLGVALVTAATPALAEKSAPAGRVMMFLDKFLKVPPAERSRVRLSYAIRHDDKPAGNLKATLVEKNGARTPLPINADGYFERLPTLAQLQGDPQIVFDVPADWKMGSAIDFAPQLKPAGEYDVGELSATVNEANTVMGKAGGILAFAAPKMSGILFEKASGGLVVFGDGRTAPLPTIASGPYFRPGDFQGAVRVKLTKSPTKVAFYSGKK